MTIRQDQLREMAREHSPTPDVVLRGKNRVSDGVRLSERTSQPRPFFCRSCGREEYVASVPAGWYSLSRHSGDPNQRTIRLGLYCSARCVDAQIPRLIGVETDAADRWTESQYHQGRTDRKQE